ncbi:uncharacterized protein METZ01_LOCUS313780 [marine metagenome]|uniref:Uncharacterized protein n=1 Tax=marine metagenome TaxID=408172 RepID=A0A382NIJ9_9ZZZZ
MIQIHPSVEITHLGPIPPSIFTEETSEDQQTTSTNKPPLFRLFFSSFF